MPKPAPYPILYSFRRCPYAMRARMALAASGVLVELREVVLSNKPPALLRASAKGTVPVLVTSEGQVIDQSLDIMMWALNSNDPLNWVSHDAHSNATTCQLIQACDNDFKPNLDRYKYPNRYDSCDALHHREMGDVFLQDLNARLQNHRYLIGETQRLADIAIAPFVRQFAHTDPIWFENQSWTALRRWLENFEQSELFTQMMPKYPAWVPDQAVVLFPPPSNRSLA